jgi:hypothetical protein
MEKGSRIAVHTLLRNCSILWTGGVGLAFKKAGHLLATVADVEHPKCRQTAAAAFEDYASSCSQTACILQM